MYLVMLMFYKYIYSNPLILFEFFLHFVFLFFSYAFLL